MIAKLFDLLGKMLLRHRFTKIYRANVWEGEESRSGGGSDFEQTTVIRAEIPTLIERLEIKSILDAPCGDFNWMKDVNLNVDYIGVDIVNDIITANAERYGNSRRKFYSLDIITDALPPTDLIICRDCLVHLTFRQAMSALRNFKKSGAKYLLTTTFVDRGENSDVSGNYSWRPLNLSLPPFQFPQPIATINEKCTENNDIYRDKCLGLWVFEDLPLSGNCC